MKSVCWTGSSIVMLCFACMTSSANEITARPAVGFEFEAVEIYMIRYNHNQNSPDARTNGSAFQDVTEREGQYVMARTEGELNNGWPFFKVTADNAHGQIGVVNLYENYGQKGPLRKKRETTKEPYHGGVLEIVTGPTPYEGSKRRNIVAGVSAFLQFHYESCVKSGSKQDFIRLKTVITEFNKTVSSATSITGADRPLMQLKLVDGDNSFISCPEKLAGEWRDKPNIGLRGQATFGAPLEHLNDGLYTMSYTRYKESELDLEALKLGLDDRQRRELNAVIGVWHNLVKCAVEKIPKKATAGNIEVLCDKSRLIPLPHVDVCDLAKSYWNGLAEKAVVRNNEDLEKALIRRVLPTIERAGDAFIDRYFTGLPDNELKKREAVASAIAQAVVNPWTCEKYWKDEDGHYLAYGDATIVPPLKLLRPGGDANTQLGLAIEFRSGSVDPWDLLVGNDRGEYNPDFTSVNTFGIQLFSVERYNDI